MGVMTKKYGVSIYFCRKLAIFGKTVGEHRWILSEFFSKTRKNSYMGQLCIINPEYVSLQFY
jgi:hypothetical protein